MLHARGNFKDASKGYYHMDFLDFFSKKKELIKKGTQIVFIYFISIKSVEIGSMFQQMIAFNFTSVLL